MARGIDRDQAAVAAHGRNVCKQTIGCNRLATTTLHSSPSAKVEMLLLGRVYFAFQRSPAGGVVASFDLHQRDARTMA